MTQEINIGVSGNAGTGKSTIVEIIREALTLYGFESITVSDTDIHPELFADRVLKLHQTGVTRINIGSHQTMRKNGNES